MWNRTVLCFVALGSIALPVTPALAVGRQNWYEWDKDFNVTAANLGTGYVHSVQAEYLIHVRARNPEGKDSSILPASNEKKAQYNPYGRESWKNLGLRGIYNSGKNTIGGVRLDPLLVTVPADQPFDQTRTLATAQVPSRAEGEARVQVSPWSVGKGWVQGSLHVEGQAEAMLPSATGRAYSYSYAGIRLNGQTRAWLSGNVKMKNTTTYRPRRGSGDMRRFVRDPIWFTVYDAVTHEVLAEDDLFEMAWETQDVPGDPLSDFTWEDDTLSLNARNATLHLGFNPLHVQQEGCLDLVIEDGLIVRADDSGLFDGLLPAVGGPGDVSFALPNEISLDYDLGDFDGRDVNVDFNGSVLAMAEAEIVPEPITLSALAVGLAVLGPYARRRCA